MPAHRPKVVIVGAGFGRLGRCQDAATRGSQEKPDCVAGPHLYRARNLVERFFNKIKQCRRVAMRYDKLAANYLAFVLLAMLERGEIHLAQGAVKTFQGDDGRFDSQSLGFLNVLAAAHPRLLRAEGGTIDVGSLAVYPLLLLNPDFLQRRSFDAACRMADLKPDIRLESGAPHALVAMAAAGHGVALFPSHLLIQNLKLRIVAITYRGKPLREPLAIFWDKRRQRTRYAIAFCEMLVAYLRDVLPIVRPTATAGNGNRKRVPAGRR